MIRINLLPVKEDKLLASAKLFLVMAVIVISAVTFVVSVHSAQLASQEEASKKAISNVNAQITRLKSVMGEIENLKKKKLEREQKIEMIVKLQKQNIGPVRVLDELSLKLPSNKIWVKQLSVRGTQLQLEGMTLDNQDVAKFMKQMEGSMFFSGVNLKKIQRKKGSKGVSLLTYALNTKIYLQGQQQTKAKKEKKEKKETNKKQTKPQKGKGGTK